MNLIGPGAYKPRLTTKKEEYLCPNICDISLMPNHVRLSSTTAEGKHRHSLIEILRQRVNVIKK